MTRIRFIGSFASVQPSKPLSPFGLPVVGIKIHPTFSQTRGFLRRSRLGDGLGVVWTDDTWSHEFAVVIGNDCLRCGGVLPEPLPLYRCFGCNHALPCPWRYYRRPDSSTSPHAAGKDCLLDHRVADVRYSFGTYGVQRLLDVGFERAGMGTDFRFLLGSGLSHLEGLH